MWRPGTPLTPRKLMSLVDGLPPESRTATRLRVEADAARQEAAGRGEDPPGHPEHPEHPEHDPAGQPWSATNMLLAALIDEIRGLRWTYAASHSREGHRPPLPQPVRRPGVGERETRPYASSLTEEQRRRLDPRLRQQELEAAGDSG